MAGSKLVLMAAFVQVNTRKGYRYLDDAGKIMNAYDEQFPQKSVGVQGLFMTNPDSKVRQIHVSTDRIWLHFDEPDTLRFATDHARLAVENICGIIGVDSFKRVGLRLQYLYPLAQPDAYMKAATQRVLGEGLNASLTALGADPLESFEVKLTVRQGDLTVAFAVSPVKKAPGADAAALPETAVMLDPDIYREGEISLPDFRRFLRNAEGWAETGTPRLAAAFLPEA